ncbi:hypothetical protein EE612_048965 [Oryza sativa]|nr:hypothetical protein EE612_048965 [Oryza sativa]
MVSEKAKSNKRKKVRMHNQPPPKRLDRAGISEPSSEKLC